MTDRFETPIPTVKAEQAAFGAFHERTNRAESIMLALRAAYAVDVPAICRAEVWNAVTHLSGGAYIDLSPSEVEEETAEYLAARFGETQECPHDFVIGQSVCGLCGVTYREACGLNPTPSAPETKGATHAFMLFDGSREVGCLFTPVERGFIRALAADTTAEEDSDGAIRRALQSAARRLLEAQ